MNAPETFCGLLAHTATRKKSPTFEDHHHLLAARAGAADAPTKR
jgi:hypothetical protein